ncbi:MAG: DUF3267 domain-containing protein [Lysinibacillus sp.]
MHCWKTLNLKHQFGTTRIFIMASCVFILIFTSSFVLLNLLHQEQFTDRYFWLFVLVTLLLYPMHKLFHFIALFDLRKQVTFRIRIQYLFIPVINLRIREPIRKKRYLLVLLTPFILINFFIIAFTVYFPAYTHYGTLLLSYHCSLCLVDILYVKYLLHSPKEAYIEETPKGYEILVPHTVG